MIDEPKYSSPRAVEDLVGKLRAENAELEALYSDLQTFTSGMQTVWQARESDFKMELKAARMHLEALVLDRAGRSWRTRQRTGL